MRPLAQIFLTENPGYAVASFLHGDLVGFAKTELLNLHLLMSQHIVVKSFMCSKASAASWVQRKRIVVVGPATVKSLAKRKVLGSLREST